MSGYPHTGCRDRAKEWYRSYTRIEAYLTGYTHPFRIVAYRKLFVTQALDAGGIAYLKKPFEIDELVAYIKRHTNTSSHASFLQIGQLTLYTQDYILMKGEQIVKRLTLSEGKLLTLLANHPDETISRQEMEQELWEDGYTNEQSLNNFMAKLRKYLSEDDTPGTNHYTQGRLQAGNKT